MVRKWRGRAGGGGRIRDLNGIIKTDEKESRR